jgi:hypothetical protein
MGEQEHSPREQGENPRDERVRIPLDPKKALQALLQVQPNSEPANDEDASGPEEK